VKLPANTLILAAAVLLAACEGVAFGPFQTAPQSVQVANNNITIAGPAGYCISSPATRDTDQGAFVLLGSCASLANNAGATAPRIAGALTASVSSESGADIDGALRQLGGFFQSPQGRAALARDGNAASVTVLSARRSRGVLLLKVRDTSPNDVSGLAAEYWRALFDIRDRIVTLSVNAFSSTPMSDADGFATLNGFVARIRQENPALVDPPVDPV